MKRALIYYYINLFPLPPYPSFYLSSSSSIHYSPLLPLFRTMDRSFDRSHSPIPPPCPSPQLKMKPLPIPPTYSRRPSLSSPSSSREQLPQKRVKSSAPDTSSESLVNSLKDVIVSGNTPPRRYSDFDIQKSCPSSYKDRQPRSANLSQSFPSSSSSSQLPAISSPRSRKHRRSDSISNAQSAIPSSSFLPECGSPAAKARSRSRSPIHRRFPCETPPPVPPLPDLKNECNARSFLSRKLPPIRIPELGLGLDEKFRSPLSPLHLGSNLRRKNRESKDMAINSFLNMDPEKAPRRLSKEGSRPLSERICIRPSHSLPDIKAAKRRGNSLVSSRNIRLGTPQQVVH